MDFCNAILFFQVWRIFDKMSLLYIEKWIDGRYFSINILFHTCKSAIMDQNWNDIGCIYLCYYIWYAISCLQGSLYKCHDAYLNQSSSYIYNAYLNQSSSYIYDAYLNQSSSYICDAYLNQSSSYICDAYLNQSSSYIYDAYLNQSSSYIYDAYLNQSSSYIYDAYLNQSSSYIYDAYLNQSSSYIYDAYLNQSSSYIYDAYLNQSSSYIYDAYLNQSSSYIYDAYLNQSSSYIYDAYLNQSSSYIYDAYLNQSSSYIYYVLSVYHTVAKQPKTVCSWCQEALPSVFNLVIPSTGGDISLLWLLTQLWGLSLLISQSCTLKTRVKNPTLLLTPSEQHFMNTSASVNKWSVNKLTCALIL